VSVCARASACMENALMTDRRVCVGERERERERETHTHIQVPEHRLWRTLRERQIWATVLWATC